MVNESLINILLFWSKDGSKIAVKAEHRKKQAVVEEGGGVNMMKSDKSDKSVQAKLDNLECHLSRM